ncbi:hypothetical protein [Streptomyces sp. NPDC058751]|uniref:hypothetical protein n=1 Tax=Streptomyces sp. NPDC058751 TaxID=3346623 RepID=UPI00369AB57E
MAGATRHESGDHGQDTERRPGDPRKVPDDLLYDRILHEFPGWLSSARAAQVL